MSEKEKILLAIIEQGGYPNFTSLYQKLGYSVITSYSMRKAMAIVKKDKPNVIVAEFNYQSDFRDRTSSLESLLATVDRMSETVKNSIKVIIFYETEYIQQLQKLQAAFSNFETLAYPIEPQTLEHLLS